MPRPLSAEIREKIISHKRNNEKEADIAKWLLVSKSTVTKTWKRFKDSDSFESKLNTRGRKSAFGKEVTDNILSKIKQQPDITLEELIEHFDLKISKSALCRKLKKHELRYKKNSFPKRTTT